MISTGTGGAAPSALAGANSGWDDAGIVIAAQGKKLRDQAAELGFTSQMNSS